MTHACCPDGSPHHWHLGQPKDGVVPARCRDCGAERTYSPPVLDGDGWGYRAALSKTDRREIERLVVK